MRGFASDLLRSLFFDGDGYKSKKYCGLLLNILIRGNHDRFLSNSQAKNALAAVKDYDEINVALEDGSMRRCVLSHNFIPMYNGHRYQGIHLHGHSHFSDEADYEIDLAEQLGVMGVHNEIYNVGCMYWNYEPVTLDEIICHGRTIRPNYGSKCEEGEENDNIKIFASH